ncbi:hypothetical protein OG599_03970 [Streptomyces sp. NBC_01335]|nr:hypothetical protein OG599_03970 [Streptomyces sp. NBC_01335]
MDVQARLTGRRSVGVVLLLELDGAEAAEPLLDPSAVAEPIDVLEERQVRLGPRGEDEAADAFSL